MNTTTNDLSPPSRPGQQNAQMQEFAVELVRQLVVPTFVLDADCRVIVWNHACENLTGMPAAEVIGTQQHWRAFYSQQRPCLADLLVQQRTVEIPRFYQAFDTMHGDARGIHAENWCGMPLRGIERYLAIDVGPIHDQQGRLIAAVETLRDMTEHKRDEAALRLTASVFEHSQDGIVITDASTRIVNVNKAFTKLTGYTAEEVIGKHPSILSSGQQTPEFYSGMWHSLHTTGQWRGEVWNRKKSGELYPEILNINEVRNAAGEIVNYVGMFSDISELKSQQERLESLANYDALTGLPNRLLLSDRLNQGLVGARRHSQQLALCFIDLDGFKAVNDRHGHDAGDALLVTLAKRMKDSLRQGDTLARIGGDEFVAILTELDHPSDCEPVIARLLGAAARPVHFAPHDLTVSASIGVAIFPDDASSADQLMRFADQAMYQAKLSGKNRFHLFSTARCSNAV